MLSHVSATCKRVALLQLFNKALHNTTLEQDQNCCDVCRSNIENVNDQMMNVTEEMLTLLTTIKFLWIKGELKIAQWIRESDSAWTHTYDKASSTSYGKFNGHSEAW